MEIRGAYPAGEGSDQHLASTRLGVRGGAHLDAVAPTLQARILVSAGHIHNYERHEESGVTYLVSGGGGAKPYEVDRTPSDLYQNTDFPNYHYVRLVLEGSRVRATMVRLGDPDAPGPHTWEVRDRFDISLPP